MDFSMFENMHAKTENRFENNSNTSRFPVNTPLAMAYVPMQQWSETYPIEKGFKKGTIFPELDFPFDPEEGCYESER